MQAARLGALPATYTSRLGRKARAFFGTVVSRLGRLAVRKLGLTQATVCKAGRQFGSAAVKGSRGQGSTQ